MSIAIEHGHIIDPANNIDRVANLYIYQGKISAIGKKPRGFVPDQTINSRNKIICPGFVDLSARLREPGYEHKATIASETLAAASSGITSICCPPDTMPIIDTSAVAELIHQRTLQTNNAKVYCLGALTHGLKGESLAAMHALKIAGCAGVSNGFAPINNTTVLRRALEYAATCNLTVHLYCEDDFLRDGGVVHEGAMSVKLGLGGIPVTAETVAVSRALLLVEQTAARVHFCRLSAAKSVDLVAEAREKGLPVTADVSISHLHMTETDLAGFNSLCHLRPPLRTAHDRDELRRALTNNVIDAICSDHQPHDEDAKAAPFSLTEPGASTIDVLLSLSLQLVNDNVLDLKTAIAALTENPARIAGINAGQLNIGAAADICIFDPESKWTVEKDNILSAGKNNPFLGRELRGKVVYTILDGKLIYNMK